MREYPHKHPVFYGTTVERTAFVAGSESKAAGWLFWDIDDQLLYQYTGSAWEIVGPGAPSDAQYLTLAVDADLDNERVFVDGDNLTGVDGGAGGNYTLGVDNPLVGGVDLNGANALVLDADGDTSIDAQTADDQVDFEVGGSDVAQLVAGGFAAGTFAFTVENTSGGAVSAGDLGYIDSAGEFKTTGTAYSDVSWAVVLVGGADNADVYVARRGRVTVALNGNCSAGDYLYTSTTAGQAQPESYVRSEVFAVALTANGAGAGGTCSALLLCNTTPRARAPTNNMYYATNLSVSDFVATINNLPGGADVVYNAPSSGDEANLVPATTSLIAKLVLANTTQGDDALIDDCNTGTNTITLTDNVPGTWGAGDTITIRSQTNTDNPVAGVYFVDLEFISDLDALARDAILYHSWGDSGAANTVCWWHPYVTGAAPKRRAFRNQVAGVQREILTPAIPVIESRICLAWDASGANTANHTIRLAAEGVAAP